MTECTNEEMRDLLPLLAHGVLGAPEAARVQAHLRGCEACSAELAALELSRRVLRAQAPQVDPAAISAAVTARLATTPTLRVERGGAAAPTTAPTAAPMAVPTAAPSPMRASAWRSRQWLAAAASILIVATVAMPFLGNGTSEGRPTVLDTLAQGSSVTTPATASASAAVSTPLASSAEVSESFADLSDADLSTLLAELEQVDATIALEPTTLRQPIVDGLEGR